MQKSFLSSASLAFFLALLLRERGHEGEGEGPLLPVQVVSAPTRLDKVPSPPTAAIPPVRLLLAGSINQHRCDTNPNVVLLQLPILVSAVANATWTECTTPITCQI